MNHTKHRYKIKKGEKEISFVLTESNKIMLDVLLSSGYVLIQESILGEDKIWRVVEPEKKEE
jgi:hypothetical protein